MTLVNRLIDAFHYLNSAGPVWHWRLVFAKCPHCGPSHFLMLRRDPFFTRCLKCRSTAINLSAIRVIQQSLSAVSNKSAYEMSTYGATYSYLKRACSEFHCSEYFPGRKSGEWIDGVLNEDAQQLSFPDESFDLITSSQVFEHVPDDLAAYRECWRTLKPGGSLIYTVPLHDTVRTEQVAMIVDGEIRWLSAPQFHGSRTTGPNSVPVFWRFSVRDISQRVSSAGFRDFSLVNVMLFPQQVLPQTVIHAVK